MQSYVFRYLQPHVCTACALIVAKEEVDDDKLAALQMTLQRLRPM